MAQHLPTHHFRRTNPTESVLIQIVTVLVILSVPCPSANAQEHDHSGQSDSIPLEILERPLPLRTGIGTSHEPVTTSSSEAQKYFDQGLSYLHSYVWIEAARSFNQALRSDPNLAMAQLGLSYAYSGLGAGAAAKSIMEKARARLPQLSGLEQQWISIRSAQLDAIAAPADPSLRAKYTAAIDKALSLFPRDVEFWLLKGNAEEPSPAGWGQRGKESSLKYYEKALAVSPDNFAAHHYIAHSLENLGRIQEALPHSESYARLAPAVAHAHHMCGHDLRRVGRMPEAIGQFEQAYRIETAYLKSENIPAEYDWHHQHNLDLLSGAYQYVGKMKAAEQMLKESFELPSLQENLALDKRGWPYFLLSRGRAQDALNASAALIGARWPAVRAIGHITASHALMAMDRMPEASTEAKAALAETQNDPAASPYLIPYLALLQGEFYFRTGQQDKGRAALEAVEAKFRSENNPEGWSQGLFMIEMIAKLSIQLGDWELAEFTARQMNEYDSNYAGTHFAKALVAEHKSNSADALKEFKLARQAWRDADSDFPEMAEVRTKISALGGP
ncbi:MAG TPA: tetratricopeptide repeat protein [Blastocatellia bacterium]|nr:tetratricopeptide repeat protein [Blastocatellia bacterium]